MRRIPKQPSDIKIRERAVDPTGSFIVQAPAGSGKTTLLVERYLNLLATVNEPEEILAITFTKKAANEMLQRVMKEIRDHSEKATKAIWRNESRNWQIELNPQRLKIQTIDSFLKGLVERMPYRSMLNMEFAPTEDSEPLYEQAAKRTLELISTDSEALGLPISRALGILDNNHPQVIGLIAKMLASRQHWIELVMESARSEVSRVPDDFIEKISATREAFVNASMNELWERRNIAFWEQVEDLCKFAANTAAHDERAKIATSFPGFESVEGFQFFAELVLTKTSKPTVRRSVNILTGFPAGTQPWSKLTAADFKDKKETMKSLLDEIQSDPMLVDQLFFARLLPAKPWDERNEQVIRDYGALLLTAVKELSDIFEERQVVDFTEIAIGAGRALNPSDRPTDLMLALDYRIKHILIDEFQDTSAAQCQLLDCVMSGWTPDDGNTFFAVGDQMQSIYMFRQANLQNFLRIAEDGMRNRELTPLQLRQNFRSSPDLVGWINELFPKIFGTENHSFTGKVAYSQSEAFKEMRGSVSLKKLITKDSNTGRYLEAHELTKDLKALLENTHPDEKVAILVRTKTHLNAYLEELRAKDIECRGVEIQKLEEIPVIQDLYSLSSILLDPTDEVSWFAVLLSPLVGIELDEIERLNKEINEGHNVWEVLKSWSTTSQSRVARLTIAFEEAQREDHRPFRSVLERFWYRLGGTHAYQGDQVLLNATRFLEYVEDCSISELSPQTIKNWISSTFATEKNESARVEVMTIHKAKGLEWDYVFIPDLGAITKGEEKPILYVEPYEENFLLSVHKYGDRDEMHNVLNQYYSRRSSNEARRLLYVALTRAKLGVYLYGVEAKSDPRTFLGFLQDAEVEFGDFTHLVHTPGDERENDSPDMHKFESRMWSRLPADYRLAPKDYMPKVAETSLAPSVYMANETSGKPENLLAKILHNKAIEIGDIVHAELHRMTRLGQIESPNEQVLAKWRNNLRTKGFDGAEIVDVLRTVQEHLQQVIEDPNGKWLLNNKHIESESEVSTHVFEDDTFREKIVDRTFVDDEGIRWIVDYKTSALTDDLEMEMTTMKERYAPQLNSYASIYRNLDDRPIQTALYLTAVPMLVQLDFYPQAI